MTELIKATRFEVIDGRIQLYDAEGNKLSGNKAYWDGNFYCYDNNLTSLEGAPKSVGGSFVCSHNKLTSLEGAPKSLGGNFYCSRNKLTSLEGAPKSVGGSFYCYDNNLTSLEGAPKSVGGSFDCYDNNLTSLEGAPKSVGGSFVCYDNNLTSLEGAPKSHQDMFNSFLEDGLVFADGILTELISHKGNLYKTKRIGRDEILWVAKDGSNYAHGKTSREALAELRFKTEKRDISQYKNMPLNTVKTTYEWSLIYRAVTGACKAGSDMFIEQNAEKKKYTLAEILDATKNAYGWKTFKEVVGA